MQGTDWPRKRWALPLALLMPALALQYLGGRAWLLAGWLLMLALLGWQVFAEPGWRDAAGLVPLLLVLPLCWWRVLSLRRAAAQGRPLPRPPTSRAAVLTGALLGFVLLMLLLRLLLIEPFAVRSSSMFPTLRAGDAVWVWKWRSGSLSIFSQRLMASGSHRPLERGELIAYEPPDRSGSVFVGRVVGLPGDELTLDKGRLLGAATASAPTRLYNEQDEQWRLSHGEHLDGRHYLISFGEGSPPSADAPRRHAALADGQYFVLGDARDNSLDSRRFGPVPAAKLIGRVVHVQRGQAP